MTCLWGRGLEPSALAGLRLGLGLTAGDLLCAALSRLAHTGLCDMQSAASSERQVRKCLYKCQGKHPISSQVS